MANPRGSRRRRIWLVSPWFTRPFGRRILGPTEVFVTSLSGVQAPPAHTEKAGRNFPAVIYGRTSPETPVGRSAPVRAATAILRNVTVLPSSLSQ